MRTLVNAIVIIGVVLGSILFLGASDDNGINLKLCLSSVSIISLSLCLGALYYGRRTEDA